MDTTNLRENYSKLISHMESAGYSADYVTKFKRVIKFILRISGSGKVSCYDDVYREYERKGRSQATLREKRIIIRSIKHFDLFGQYPDGTRKETLPQKAYNQLCDEYKSIIDYYVEVETRRGLKGVVYLASGAETFFLQLQQFGIHHLLDITEKNVLEVFAASSGRMLRQYSWKRSIAQVLKACIPAYPYCEKVLVFLPAITKSRKNIQYLTAEEIEKVKNTLSDEGACLSLRDKAIGTLALYTGLRGCDIANITLDTIDWENDFLHIHQQKTGVPLSLPMSAIVGNAIYDYIKEERPKSDCKYIFLTKTAPIRHIKKGGNMFIISARIMKSAGIRQEPGDRKGFHIFRHHFATKLLSNGIPRPVICNLTGLISPDSLDTYLSADFKHLKECALSIERFPVAKGVFVV